MAGTGSFRVLEPDPADVMAVLETDAQNSQPHFVDEHWNVLVNKTRDLAPILYDLRQKHLLSKRQCYDISWKNSSQEKMRELYYHSRFWVRKDKDVFFNILKKHNPSLIADLESGRYTAPEQSGTGSFTVLETSLADMMAALERDAQNSRRHIVDEHWDVLRNEISDVEPILKDLLEMHLLSKRQYTDIHRKKSSQDQMRELYYQSRSWSRMHKDVFFHILKKHNPSLTADLQSGRYKAPEKSVTGTFRVLETSPADVMAALKCDAQHSWLDFVDEHEDVLVNKITKVEPILNDLLEEELLCKWQYNYICRKRSSQEKMKTLYYLLSSTLWNSKDKDEFFRILKRHNPSLIADLQSGRYKEPEQSGPPLLTSPGREPGSSTPREVSITQATASGGTACNVSSASLLRTVQDPNIRSIRPCPLWAEASRAASYVRWGPGPS